MSSNNPQISVVIPSYKHGHLIGRAIDSVINQTYKNWEILIIDNFSTDNTKEVVTKYTLEYSNIKFIQINNNGIIAKSRNKGIKRSTGSYIAFLDSDDWWELNKLSLCVEAINKGHKFIYHNSIIKKNYQDFNFLNKLIASKPKKPLISNFLVHGVIIPNSSVVVCKDLLKEISYLSEDTILAGVEDQHTWLRISLVTSKFYKIDKFLSYYWIDKNNFSKPSTIQYEKLNRLHKNFFTHLKEEKINKASALLAYKKGRVAMQIGEFQNGKNFFFESIRFNLTLKYFFKAIFFLFFCLVRKSER